MPISPDGEAEVEKTEGAEVSDVKQPAADPSTEPTAGENEPQGSLLDAVKKALKGEEASPASDEPDAKPAGQQTAEGGDPAEKSVEGDEFSKEELEAQKPKTRERIEKLAREKNAFRAQVDELAPKAQFADTVLSFAAENRLSKDDLNNTLQIAALVRNDPVKALDRLEPMVAELRRLTGREMPADLREQVELGYTTRPVAEELARARAAQVLQQQREQDRMHDESVRSARSAQQQSVHAANEWYASQKASDPDFTAKESFLTQRAELEILRIVQNERRIPTADETRQMLDRVKGEIDTQFRALRGTPKPMREVDATTSRGAPSPKPQTYLEAARQALQQS